jgi:hypothetical protein
MTTKGRQEKKRRRTGGREEGRKSRVDEGYRGEREEEDGRFYQFT